MIARPFRSAHDRLFYAIALTIIRLFVTPCVVLAQAQEFTPIVVNGNTVTGLVRTRIESWDWFGGAPNGTYTYPASLIRVSVARTTRKRDWQVEFSAPILLGLPEQPLGAGPAGLGANYFVANDRSQNAAGLFVKQAFLRFKGISNVEGQSVKVGRMEFFDGAEVSPKNQTLAALKRDRVASRLLANFGFTHVQRSFDGVQYVLENPNTNFTLLAARPTRGVFQVNGWGQLNINVVYGAITHEVGGTTNVAEWRVFGLWYGDHRDGVLKVDNRPFANRQVDDGLLNIGTFGGHYIHAVESPHGTIDLLFWGAGQAGSWGQLTHRAGAFAAEMGWRPGVTPLAPWLRGGFNYASGDHNANDSTHGTFFQLLPTPRLYARFPFFNLMNSTDVFGEVMLRPTKGLTTRIDVHSLHLADSNDLWYQGGGAFQQTTFGYVGQPGGGRPGLAILYDASTDVLLTPRVSLSGYYGYATGGAAAATIYPANNHAALGYIELVVRF